MKRLKVPGWDLTNLNKDALCEAIAEAKAEPAVKQAARRLILEISFAGTKWSVNTIMGYKVRARKLIATLLLASPEDYGLCRIDIGAITKPMTSAELAAFCQVPVSRVYKLARGSPGNGLPEPYWPLGRTLKGRGWKFPPEFAQLYARRLMGQDYGNRRRNHS